MMKNVQKLVPFLEYDIYVINVYLTRTDIITSNFLKYDICNYVYPTIIDIITSNIYIIYMCVKNDSINS